MNQLTTLLSRARFLVFDFDGTLVDSTEIKKSGFEYAFQDFPGRLSEIMAYCRGSNHTIRREKFRHVYENILHLPYSADVDRVLHERYAAVTTEAVIHAPEIPGASSFLNRMAQGYQTAILSSTPDAILKDILDARQWRRFFHFIQGAPIDKTAWLVGMCEAQQLLPNEVFFFGDTHEDLGAGKAAGCVFVGVRNAELAKTAEVDCYIENFENAV